MSGSVLPSEEGDLPLIMELQDQILSKVATDMEGVIRFILDSCGDQEAYISQFIVLGIHYHSHHLNLYVSLVDKLLRMDPFLELIPALKQECKSAHKRYNDTPCQKALHRSLYRFIYQLYFTEIFDLSDVLDILSSYLTKRSCWEMTNTVSELALWFGPELSTAKDLLNLKRLENHLLSYGKDDWQNVKSNRNSPESYNHLFKAITSDDVDLLIKLSESIDSHRIEESEFDTSWILSETTTPIYLSARYGSLKCFRHLFLNATAIDRDELAKAAIIGGNPEIVRLSEQLGCNYSSFLDLSIVYHQYGIFDWILGQTDVTYLDESTVFDAVVSGNVHVLDSILENKLYDFHKRDSSGMTMLHYAVKFGTELSARFLIEVAKLDINAKENRSLTPLHYAVKTRNAALTKRLLSYAAADPNIGDENGTTPLHYAVQNADKEITNVLLACPRIKPYTKNKVNNTPAYVANQKQLPDLSNLIRKKIGLMSHAPVIAERPKTAPSRPRSANTDAVKTADVIRQRPSTAAVTRKQTRPLREIDVVKQRSTAMEHNSVSRREQTPTNGRRVQFNLRAPRGILYCG